MSIKAFINGAGAGLVSIILSSLMRILYDAPFLPEIAAQTLFSLVPGEVESQLVGTLGVMAKYIALAGSIATNVVVYGLIGILLANIYSKLKDVYAIRLALSFIVVYPLLLAIAATLVNITEVSAQPITLETLSSSLIIPTLAFSAMVSTFQPYVKHRKAVCEAYKAGFSRKRRVFIKATLAGTAVATLLVFGLDMLFPKRPSKVPSNPGTVASRPGIFSGKDLEPLIANEVTPNDRFYRVDVNIVPPKVNPNDWRLSVKGLVENPLELSYEGIRQMPSVEEYATLECVSNKIGGSLMSNAKWRGVRLKDILEMAKVKPGATYVVFRCYDGYDVGIPLERALLEGTILAYEMNGETLPVEHGFPVRAVVPGLYGMMNAKWVKEVEVVSYEYLGFWQRKGWTNKAEYKTHSTILIPGNAPLRKRFKGLLRRNVVAGRNNVIAGVAFAGDRGIKKVEVSVDGGKTWVEASVKDPLSGYTWVIWAADWLPLEEGDHRLMVRATDGFGMVQTAEIRRPFPEGATGYHVVDIIVKK